MEQQAHILIVEDEQKIRAALVDFLEFHGFKVSVAVDGLEAERIVAEKQFDLQISFAEPVLDVLINRLGYKPAQANQMIKDALQRDDSISSPEQLFDEIFNGDKA